MSETPPLSETPKYDFTSEQIAKANAGDQQALASKYIEQNGGFWGATEEDSEDALMADLKLDDDAAGHAQKVVQRVHEMYEDAYAENERRSNDSEK